jgi:Coenzyme PQQ synthesis protein D (PqqD)
MIREKMHLPIILYRVIPNDRLFVVKRFYQVNKPDVVMESFEGELVLVQMKSGNYYSLQGSAPLIWEMIEHGRSVEDTGDYLVARHQGAEEEVRRSLHDLVEELVAESLIVPAKNGSATAVMEQPEAAEPDTPFVPPVLERYTDMQELLLLDPIHDVDQSGWPRRKGEGES